MGRSVRVGLLVAATVWAAVGCYQGGRMSPPPTGEVREGVTEGNRAPEIAGVDADGRRFALSDYRGKVVLLDFWFES